MSNEQWKLNGNCDLCRRKYYCKNKCKAHKERVDTEIRMAFYKEMYSVMRKK